MPSPREPGPGADQPTESAKDSGHYRGKATDYWISGRGCFGLQSKDGCFRRTPTRTGWIENHNVAIEYRWSEGRTERYAEITAEFVQST